VVFLLGKVARNYEISLDFVCHPVRLRIREVHLERLLWDSLNKHGQRAVMERFTEFILNHQIHHRHILHYAVSDQRFPAVLNRFSLDFETLTEELLGVVIWVDQDEPSIAWVNFFGEHFPECFTEVTLGRWPNIDSDLVVVQPESWVDVAVLRIGHWLKLCYLHEQVHIEQMYR